MSRSNLIKQLTNPRYLTRQPKLMNENLGLYKTPNVARTNKVQMGLYNIPNIPKFAKGGDIDLKELSRSKFKGRQSTPIIPYDSAKAIHTYPMKKEDDVMKVIKPKYYISQLHSGDNISKASYKHVKENFSKMKTPIKVISNEIKISPTSNMFPWFPTLVNRIERDGINVSKIVPRTKNQIVKQLNLGNEHIFMYIHTDGTIRVDVQSPNASYPHSKTNKATFSMEYTPPQTHVDKQRDIVLTIPATFKYVEKRAHLYPNEQGLGAVSKYTEVHPSIALSDTAPLESKLTNKQVNVIRQQRGIREGQHKNTPVHLDLLARKI